MLFSVIEDMTESNSPAKQGFQAKVDESIKNFDSEKKTFVKKKPKSKFDIFLYVISNSFLFSFRVETSTTFGIENHKGIRPR